jgi:DNA-binding CsgD family transcriptional regulator
VAETQSDPTDVEESAPAAALGGPLPLVLSAFLVLVVAGGTVDLLLDRPPTLLSWHVAFEATMVLISLVFALVLFRGWRRSAAGLRRTEARLAVTQQALVDRQAERDRWRRDAERALLSFGLAIDRQFDAWDLSPAEREVALLILKGEGHKQAAALLGRSERTVRQHAVEVYRKAGLRGRAELAAFFLQDLILPEGQADGREPGHGVTAVPSE